MKLKSGDRLGDWVVKKALGEGGMGSVYLCHSVLSDDVLAAVKVLIPSALGDVEQRFVQEMKTLAALNHPAIVRVLGGGRDEARGLLYMAMELIDGEDLEHRLARGPMSGEEVLAVFGPVLAALSYAHRRGVAHRDIKPANIMIRRDGTPVIVDFGIAVVEGQTRHTRAGMVPGTLMYLPPEVFQGETPDPKSGDAYALGVIMWEALTGKSAFGADPGTTDSQQMAQVMGKKMKAEALDTGPHTPPALREVILRTTDPEPESRLSDLEAARVRITGPAVDGAAPGGAAPGGAPPPAAPARAAVQAEARPKRGGSWLWTGLLGVGALGLVGAVVVLAAVIVLIPVLWFSFTPSDPGPVPMLETDAPPPPHPQESWVDRAREALQAGKLPAARVHAERAFSENPEDPAAMLVLGEVLLAEGDSKAATPYLCAAKSEGLSPIPGVDDGKIRCGARPAPPPRPPERITTPNRGPAAPPSSTPSTPAGAPTPAATASTPPPSSTPSTPAATASSASSPTSTSYPSSTPSSANTPAPSSTASSAYTPTPAPTPAAGGPIPGGKPKVTQTNLAVQGELDAAAVKLVLQAKAPAIKRCYSVAFEKSVAQGEAPPQGTLAIKISIRTDGTIFSSGGVTVVQDSVGAGVATCAAAALGGLIFPKDYGGNTVATWTFDMRVEA